MHPADLASSLLEPLSGKQWKRSQFEHMVSSVQEAHGCDGLLLVRKDYILCVRCLLTESSVCFLGESDTGQVLKWI